ncbi:hypothetical protein AWB68_06824 [Caballeronia choica]|uniref:Uncharacterized protein n=1 Tax=Caballeronia choica TaxID=326476 RepID=A0A158KQ07_9BURK|nr:hypothetical protein AWB68_06824 [Caballeronia choica]
MSLRELFRHCEPFVGCIAISRVTRLRAEDTLRREQDVTASNALAAALFFPLGDRSGDFLSITAQGYNYPSAGPLSRARLRRFVQHSCKGQAGHVRCRATRSSPARFPPAAGARGPRARRWLYRRGLALFQARMRMRATRRRWKNHGHRRARPPNDGGRLSPPNGNCGVARYSTRCKPIRHWAQALSRASRPAATRRFRLCRRYARSRVFQPRAANCASPVSPAKRR